MADPTEPGITESGPSNSTSEPTTEASSSAPPTPQCAQCGKSPSTLKQCLKCHSVSYCDKDCQKAHFKVHKKVCASLAQEYVKANEPKMASRSTQSTKGARDRGLQKWQASSFEEVGIIRVDRDRANMWCSLILELWCLYRILKSACTRDPVARCSES
jgi:hypothetical protein